MSPLPIPAKVYQKEKEVIFHPRQIYDILDKHVFGQESAKKSLSVILHQHLTRYNKKLTSIKKNNCILIGPSGCGKSLMISTLVKTLSLPFISLSATTLVQRGYRGGMHAGDIARQLRSAAKYDEHRARYGIVLIDEIDKLAKVDDEGSIATSGVQNDLLSMIDGYRNMPTSFDDGDYVDSFDTSNILFIFAGAFQELTQYTYFSNEICHSALVKYGLLPELANRMGTIIPFKKLEEQQIRKIVERAINEYDHYIKISSQEKGVYVELIMAGITSNDNQIAMGARAIQNAVQQFYEEKIFNSPFDHQLQLILNVFDGKIV